MSIKEGEKTVRGIEHENGDGEEMSNKNSKREIEESLTIIDRIRDRGKTMNKEAIKELYNIGNKTDEDWGKKDKETN